MRRTGLLALGTAVAFASLVGWPHGAFAEPKIEQSPVHARPHVLLDRLTLPRDLVRANEVAAHLRRTLKRETRRANWGAGTESRIRYRFAVESLEVRAQAGVLHVSCTALGRLPRGKSAKSQIAFGGDPRDERRLIERVLDIVARGVVTRLAELERQRRHPYG